LRSPRPSPRGDPRSSPNPSKSVDTLCSPRSAFAKPESSRTNDSSRSNTPRLTPRGPR
jgi:hypothetical protein